MPQRRSLRGRWGSCPRPGWESQAGLLGLKEGTLRTQGSPCPTPSSAGTGGGPLRRSEVTFSPALPCGRGGRHLSFPENASGGICPKLLTTPLRGDRQDRGFHLEPASAHWVPGFGAFPHPGHTQGAPLSPGLAVTAASTRLSETPTPSCPGPSKVSCLCLVRS